MNLVERMVMTPQACLYCGKGNTPDDETGDIGPFLDLQRDVNWGDSVYLCRRCCSQIAALWGFIHETQKVELERALQKKDEEIHELKSDLDSAHRRLRVISAGSRTLKRVKAQS